MSRYLGICTILEDLVQANNVRVVYFRKEASALHFNRGIQSWRMVSNQPYIAARKG